MKKKQENVRFKTSYGYVSFPKPRRLGFFQALAAAAKRKGVFIWRGSTLLGGMKNMRIRAALVSDKEKKGVVGGFIYTKQGLITDRGAGQYGVGNKLFENPTDAVEQAIKEKEEHFVKVKSKKDVLTPQEYMM